MFIPNDVKMASNEACYALAFHGTKYQMTLTINDDVLRIEAEEEKTGLSIFRTALSPH